MFYAGMLMRLTHGASALLRRMQSVIPTVESKAETLNAGA